MDHFEHVTVIFASGLMVDSGPDLGPGACALSKTECHRASSLLAIHT